MQYLTPSGKTTVEPANSVISKITILKMSKPYQYYGRVQGPQQPTIVTRSYSNLLHNGNASKDSMTVLNHLLKSNSPTDSLTMKPSPLVKSQMYISFSAEQIKVRVVVCVKR